MHLSHLRHQLPAIAASVRVVTARPGSTSAPGPILTRRVGPRPPALVSDYLRFCKGDPKAWRGRLPPHLFPQWGWPVLAECLHGLPYDLKTVVNAGFSWKVSAPLPSNEALDLEAQLTSIDDNGHRALVNLRLVTGTASAPAALEAGMTVFLPLKRGGSKKQRPRVPLDGRPIADRRLGPRSGLEFALLTGDPNPIHWLGPYAKAAGFKGTILHGFAQGALVAEALTRELFSGDIDRLVALEGRFTKPLRLPARVRVFAGPGSTVSLGHDPGGPAYLTGEFQHV